MRAQPRPPIEQLCRDLHGQILRVIHPPGADRPMPWQEFARRARLKGWTRHAHWKLREGELRWKADRLIEVAGNLGIRTSIVVEGLPTDSLLADHRWPTAGEIGQGNAPCAPSVPASGTGTPTTHTETHPA